MQGKKNIAVGFLFLAAFMLYGFVLIYLRDFAPGKEAWIAAYAVGRHFESRLAHVHGALFAFINVVVGYLLLRLPVGEFAAKGISWLALAGMLMPLGILAEVPFGLPPLLVIGAWWPGMASSWPRCGSTGRANSKRRPPGMPTARSR